MVGVKRWGKFGENVCVLWTVPDHFYVPMENNLQVIRDQDRVYVALRAVVDTNNPPPPPVPQATVPIYTVRQSAPVQQPVQPTYVQYLEQRLAQYERPQQQFMAPNVQQRPMLPPPLVPRVSVPRFEIPQSKQIFRSNVPSNWQSYSQATSSSIVPSSAGQHRFPPSSSYSYNYPRQESQGVKRRRQVQEVPALEIDSVNVLTKRLRGLNFELDRMRLSGQESTSRFMTLLKERDDAAYKHAQLKKYFPMAGSQEEFFQWRNAGFDKDPREFVKGALRTSAITVDESPPREPLGMISPAEDALQSPSPFQPLYQSLVPHFELKPLLPSPSHY